MAGNKSPAGAVGPVERRSRSLDCLSAWEANWSCDCMIAFAWRGPNEERLLVAVNYAPNQSQCYVRLPFDDLRDSQWRLDCLLSDVSYDRNGSELASRGLYLDLAPWQTHIFAMQRQAKKS